MCECVYMYMCMHTYVWCDITCVHVRVHMCAELTGLEIPGGYQGRSQAATRYPWKWTALRPQEKPCSQESGRCDFAGEGRGGWAQAKAPLTRP